MQRVTYTTVLKKRLNKNKANMEDPIIMDQDCLWCSKPNCQDKCPKCGLLAYCSEAHLQNHLDEDGQCLPFRIRFCQSKGRYGEATRDIEPTELILRDKVPWLHFWSFKKKK